MHGTRITVYNKDGDIIGHAWHTACDNIDCTTAIVNGRPWHACPIQAGVELMQYHFPTIDQAIRTLMEVYQH
jgi:hypothetical protein